MKKRILAWATLIGFVLFIINLVFVHIYQEASFVIYAFIVVIYLFVLNKGKKK